MSEEKIEKTKRSKEDILEIVIAIFLGITALATAWASWIGSLHGGNMSTNYTRSNNLAADGNARWNEASQSLMQDMQVWNLISDYQVEILYASMRKLPTRLSLPLTRTRSMRTHTRYSLSAPIISPREWRQ